MVARFASSTSRPEASHFCTLPGLYPLSTFSKSYPGVPVSQTLTRSQIAENIGLGAPVAPHATNMEYIREAAQLGGASTFVEKFPDQYGTYLERPVKDYYSGYRKVRPGVCGVIIPLLIPFMTRS